MNLREKLSVNRDELKRAVERDFSRRNPLIGAKGPTDPGPEVPWANALRRAGDRERKRMAAVLMEILTEQTPLLAGKASQECGFLLFNIFALLESAPLPEVFSKLDACRAYKEQLQELLAPEDDLYNQLLRAMVANQPEPREESLWVNLLREDGGKYVIPAAAGLRRCGWRTAVRHMHEVYEASERNPGTLHFWNWLAILITNAPDANWPWCAGPYLASGNDEIWRLIKEVSPKDAEPPAYGVLTAPKRKAA